MVAQFDNDATREREKLLSFLDLTSALKHIEIEPAAAGGVRALLPLIALSNSTLQALDALHC
jgi:hypothetical protein